VCERVCVIAPKKEREKKVFVCEGLCVNAWLRVDYVWLRGMNNRDRV
jgi:hypothetical protein